MSTGPSDDVPAPLRRGDTASAFPRQSHAGCLGLALTAAVLSVAGLFFGVYDGRNGPEMATVTGGVLVVGSLVVVNSRRRAQLSVAPALGVLVGACLMLVLGAIPVLTRLPHVRTRRTMCANHLRQLAGIYMTESIPGRTAPSGGLEPFVTWCERRVVRTGQGDVFVCPGDADILDLEDDPVGRVERLTTARDAPPASTADLVSFAVRDVARYPFDADAGPPGWLMCDRQGRDGRTPHHRDGLNVLFDNGAVKFLDREDLGLGPDEPIVVGPDSEHPELRKMILPGR